MQSINFNLLHKNSQSENATHKPQDTENVTVIQLFGDIFHYMFKTINLLTISCNVIQSEIAPYFRMLSCTVLLPPYLFLLHSKQ